MAELFTGKHTIRTMAQDDLEMVFSWRNHPDVRRYMFTQREIEWKEHCLWFEKTSSDPRKFLLIFEEDSLPIGFLNFNEKNEGGIADWSFHTAPNAPKGSGKKMGFSGLDYAFEKLRFHKVAGRILDYNKRSIDFHIHFGFTLEGVLRDQYFDGDKYHSIHCFGLFVEEWLAWKIKQGIRL